MSAKIEIILVVLGIAQRRRFGVDRVLLFADVGVAQDAHPLGVGGHDSVFDAVVDHLDEVAGAVGTAVQIALLGGAAESSRVPVCAECHRCPGASVAKIGSRCFTTAGLAANHHAIAALQTPDAAACSDIDVVDVSSSRVLWRAGCRPRSTNCRHR